MNSVAAHVRNWVGSRQSAFSQHVTSAAAPIAAVEQFCNDASMRSLSPLLMGAVALASCASQPIEITASKCWSVSVGDKVEGTAVLLAQAQTDGCIECGAWVSGRGCPAIDFAIGSVSVDQAYDRIVKSAHPDRSGFVQSIVYLSGEVISNAATGKPMIRATHLRLAEAAQRNGS